MVRIAVIGAGSVGSHLADGLHRAGQDVVIGARAPADVVPPNSVPVTSIEDAVEGASVLVLAVPVAALAELVPALHLADGQIVVDATNAIAGPVPGGEPTVAAFVRAQASEGVAVVKAFNTIGAEHMVDGTVDHVPAFLPIAGDEHGVEVVADLARSIGFDPVVIGGLDAVDLVESHARLWIHLMRSGFGRDFGFALIGFPNREGAG